MPIYEYICPSCGVFEEMQKIFDAPLTACPRGHSGVERKMSASGFILKGSGWYVTDYARKGANGAGGKKESAAADAGSSDVKAKPEKSTDSKPATSSTKSSETGTGSGG